MIKISDINGQEHYLSAEAIMSISQAGASSAWHGIRSYVKLFDGKVIEAREDADRIAATVDSEQRAAAQGD